jgi:hypothetical protein
LQLVGVNFHGFESSYYQNRSIPPPPKNYTEDSFRIFAENGIKCVRVTLYWESWELNRDRCLDDLSVIADSADKYEVMCIYDNHQWECSSWLGYGIGMPNSVMSKYYEKRPADAKPNYDIIKDFWDKWWNRKIRTVNDKDGWEAQLSYFVDVIKLLDNRKSTFCFEVLNEPEVFMLSHYKKVGQYHEYMIKEIRKITNKPLMFCWALPHGAFDNPIHQALVCPNTDENIIYDGHAYPPSVNRMIYFKLIKLLMAKKVPLYLGEFNSGYVKGTTVTQTQFLQYVKRLKRFGTCGWALWRWSYLHDDAIPAFNLAEIIDDTIRPGQYFHYFINALKV